MIRRTLLVALLAALALWPGPSEAEGDVLAVVVNPANPTVQMTRDELRPVYLTTKTAWKSGKTIEPLNLPEGNGLRVAFDAAVLGMSPDDVASYWIDRRIRGDSRPPRKLPSPTSVLAVVATNEGAIGYVPMADVNGRVRVVARVENGQVVSP